MKITYIFGNGFDIHFGLKSRYIDFYNWLGKETNKRKYDNNIIAKNIFQYIDEKRHNEMQSVAGTNWESKIDWSDFEEALRALVEHYSHNQDYEDDLEKIINDLDVLSRAMSEYLSIETSNRNKSLDFNAQTIENSLNAPLRKMKSERLSTLNNALQTEFGNHYFKKTSSDLTFINFNYTFLLRDYIENTSEFNIDKINANLQSSKVMINKEILYPNGRFDDTPILGIGSEYDLPENLNITEEQKIILCKDVYASYRSDGRIDKIMKALDESDIIICYGLSIGISDATYISKLLESLMNHQYQTAIVIMYDEDYDKNDVRYQSLMNEKKIKQRLEARYTWRHSEIDEEKKQLLSQTIKNQVIIQFDNGKSADNNSRNFDYFPYESIDNETSENAIKKIKKIESMKIEIN